MSIGNILRIITALIMLPVNLFYALTGGFAVPEISRNDKYLFVHFTGNAPECERIHFAVSEDGYNFSPLNSGKEIIIQQKGTGCVRDPFILRGKDGFFYIIGTDMKSELGWTSNHALVTWKSRDLINWTDETIIDMRDFEGFEHCNRAWAPEAIWDEDAKAYMVYWAISTQENDVAALYYAHTKDFKTLTPPQLLYERKGIQTIDGDIGYNEKNGYYYLYFKHDEDQKIAWVRSKKLTGPYEGESVVCSLSENGVEGSTIYPINGTDTFVMIMDEYGTGSFFMQQTKDFENFKPVRKEAFSFENVNPRHGSVVSITDEEYARLIEAFGTAE